MIKIFTIFQVLVPFIIELCQQAEIYFTGEKTGEQKKAAVVGALEAIAKGAAEASTGGQKETWEKISGLVSKAVDVACALLF